jgi:hypothetical protein
MKRKPHKVRKRKTKRVDEKIDMSVVALHTLCIMFGIPTKLARPS